MKIIGIDLSLRSTGLAYTDTEKNITHFLLIETDKKKLDGELLLIHNAERILEFISEFDEVDQINLEGLSFNSKSGSKDVIAGNLWHLRVRLHQEFPYIPLNVIPVTSWRSPLFNKAERDEMLKNKKALELIKKDKEQKLLRKELELKADIKYQTYLKCPLDIKAEIDGFIVDGIYDLSDAYFLSTYIPGPAKPIKAKKKKGKK